MWEKSASHKCCTVILPCIHPQFHSCFGSGGAKLLILCRHAGNNIAAKTVTARQKNSRHWSSHVSKETNLGDTFRRLLWTICHIGCILHRWGDNVWPLPVWQIMRKTKDKLLLTRRDFGGNTPNWKRQTLIPKKTNGRKSLKQVISFTNDHMSPLFWGLSRGCVCHKCIRSTHRRSELAVQAEEMRPHPHLQNFSSYKPFTCFTLYPKLNLVVPLTIGKAIPGR